MNAPIIDKPTAHELRNRHILIVVGIIILALLIMAALWQRGGRSEVKRDAPVAEKMADAPR